MAFKVKALLKCSRLFIYSSHDLDALKAISFQLVKEKKKNNYLTNLHVMLILARVIQITILMNKKIHFTEVNLTCES